MLEFQAYQTMLTRLQLQLRMNKQEIEQYRQEKLASNEKISRLDQKTTELQEKLAASQLKRAHKEEYSKFAETLNKEKKFEIERIKLVYDEFEGKEEQDENEEDEEDEKMDVEDEAGNDREGSNSGEEDDVMDLDIPVAESESPATTTATPTKSAHPAASTSAPRKPAVSAPPAITGTVTKSGRLNLSRDEAESHNLALLDEIADLEARKEMYERTWNQRRDHFTEIIDSLHRFRSQVLEEKMEQERQEGMEEDQDQDRDREQQQSQSQSATGAQNSRAASVHDAE